MSKLRERYLLLKAVKFVIVPVIVFATFGSFFPYMQALVPVHESDSCICLFFHQDNVGKRKGSFPILSHVSTETAKNSLIGINSTTFYAVNWLFLLVNIHAIYKIRKMKDRLDIRLEMTWAVALWSFFDFFQYVFYFFTQLDGCGSNSTVLNNLIKYAPEFSYITIILRDFAVHCVMIYFIIRVNKRE